MIVRRAVWAGCPKSTIRTLTWSRTVRSPLAARRSLRAVDRDGLSRTVAVCSP